MIFPDPRIKRPCPFCQEATFLLYNESSTVWPVLVDGDTRRDADGYDVYDYVDAVSCMVCHALVPLIAWNREIPADELATLRRVELDPAQLHHIGPPAGSASAQTVEQEAA